MIREGGRGNSAARQRIQLYKTIYHAMYNKIFSRPMFALEINSILQAEFIKIQDKFR